MASDVRIFKTPEEVARATAERFFHLSDEAIRARGEFSVALSGGSTPKLVYQLLAGAGYAKRVLWEHTHVFFGDERCVPPDDPASNYLMARQALLALVPLPPENVRRMRGEAEPNEAAGLYEKELGSFFIGETWPRFDLVLLGMGDDGHTASLFPGSPALAETSRRVAANWVAKLNSYRLTLTFPSINHSRHIMFIVTGAAKAARLREALAANPEAAAPLPARLVRPTAGTLEWYVDEDAASGIKLFS